MQRYGSWAYIVGLNSMVGFTIGGDWFHGALPHWMGMIFGVITWYFIYVFVDNIFLSSGNTYASDKLMRCAQLRIFIQLTWYPDLFAAILAVLTFQYLASFFGDYREDGFWFFYFTTVITGFYLSIMCAVIFLLLDLFMNKSE